MSQYMPGDKKYLNPMGFHAWGTNGKLKIHHLDNFDTFYTLAEALAPLVGPTGEILLPYSMSPRGLAADMGVRINVHTVPDFTGRARTTLEPGWTRQDIRVCPAILTSLSALGTLLPISRPFWLLDFASSLTQPSPAPTKVEDTVPHHSRVGDQTSTAPPAPIKVEDTDPSHSRVGAQTSTASSSSPLCAAGPSSSGHQRRQLTIVCPGLRSDSLPEISGELSIINPRGLTAYGPTAKLEEKFHKGYAMPLFPTPTIHGLKLVLATEEALDIWGALGYTNLSRTEVKPLPSWWHLPSDAVTTALSLILALFGDDPVAAIQELVHSRVEVRRPHLSPTDTEVEIFGFSAGSYTGMLVYRVLIEKGHALGCSFHSGTLGAITFHPIMLYDFCMHEGQSPIASTKTFKASQGTPLLRPTLKHCAVDQLCMWNPSDEEARGIRSLGYRLLLIKLKDHLYKVKPFGYSHHNYSMLLAPVAQGNITSLEDLGIPELFDLADVSTNGEKFFGTLLSIIAIISIDTLGSFLLRLACRDPVELIKPSEYSRYQPPTKMSPYLLFWDLLSQETRVRHSLAAHDALQELFPLFESQTMAVPEDHQQWLLFFALPGALSRHAESGHRPAAKTLEVMKCQTDKIAATTTLDASIGKLTMKLSIHPSEDDVKEGWAVFLADDVEHFDFQSLVEASQAGSNDKGLGKKGSGKKGKGEKKKETLHPKRNFNSHPESA